MLTFMAYETFWNLIGIVMRHDGRDYIGQNWKEYENVHRYCNPKDYSQTVWKSMKYDIN